MGQNHRFCTRFRVNTKPVLTVNDAKGTLGQKRGFGTRCRVTVMTKPVLTKNDGKRILDQNRRCSTRFRVTETTKPF